MGALEVKTGLGIDDGCDAVVLGTPHAAVAITTTAPPMTTVERSIPITSG
jgi:hypothetical protein